MRKGNIWGGGGVFHWKLLMYSVHNVFSIPSTSQPQQLLLAQGGIAGDAGNLFPAGKAETDSAAPPVDALLHPTS